jgi:hypothetical protein
MDNYGSTPSVAAQPYKGLMAYIVSLFYPFSIFILPFAFLFMLLSCGLFVALVSLLCRFISGYFS